MASVPVAVLDEFLGAGELGWLWQFAMAREPMFVTSQVTSDGTSGNEDARVRRSRVLYDVAEIHPLFSSRIMQYFPAILRTLRHAPFTVNDIELQVTSSTDGEFFRPHSDVGGGAASNRELTFVYFCHREPRSFFGGELRVFDVFEPVDGRTARGEVVRPSQNRIVFFPSHYIHEVAPLSCPSSALADSRLTFNGWLHR